MGTRTLLIAGIGLLVLGIAQIFQVTSATETFVLTSCLGHEYVFEAGAGRAAIMHCWGCYAAIAGAVLMAASVMRRFGDLSLMRR